MSGAPRGPWHSVATQPWHLHASPCAGGDRVRLGIQGVWVEWNASSVPKMPYSTVQPADNAFSRKAAGRASVRLQAVRSPGRQPLPAERTRPQGALLAARTVGLVAALGLACAATALAQGADRQQPLIIEAERPGVVDLQRQVVVFSGNVIVAQGSMVLRAEQVELREAADGYRSATAVGGPSGPATWRQRRGTLDETVEGSADRIEFDGRADTLRFVGNGVVRRLRGSTVADEISGAVIQWDNTAEVFSVAGQQATATNPAGRVRVILSPRADGAAAGAPPAPQGRPAEPIDDPRRPAVPLEPSRSLGGPR
jgi:lipopolysaccharide export system protein LptA